MVNNLNKKINFKEIQKLINKQSISKSNKCKNAKNVTIKNLCIGPYIKWKLLCGDGFGYLAWACF